MTDKLWKKVEREIAKVLGGTRNPVSGRQRGDKADIQHPLFSVEVKHRESLPAWMLEAMDQAEKSVRDNQVPIVILHEKNMKFTDSLTIMRLSVILDIMAKYAKKEV